MSFPASHVAAGNQILAALDRHEYPLLFSDLEKVHLSRGQVLYRFAEPISYAFFILSGMVSLLATTQEGFTTELSIVSNEGLIGIPPLLGVNRAPYQIEAQISGNAMRVSTGVLVKEFNRSGPLHDMILRYTHSLLSQVSQSAACNRFHQLDERLCRWLLICHDRVKSDTLQLTHEVLSHMLGATRANVTAAANHLKRRGLIRASRGRIQIIDRKGLEATACECYRLVSEELGYFRAG